jgi:hypothetical protein
VPRHNDTAVACVEHIFVGEEKGSCSGHVGEPRCEKNGPDEPSLWTDLIICNREDGVTGLELYWMGSAKETAY